MKGILTLSLLLNLLAVGAVAYLVTSKPRADIPATASATNSAASGKHSSGKSAVGSLGLTNTVAQTNKIDWRMVESEDYRQYIANLRSIGCPEETIRDIIIADVNKLFEARKKQLRAASTNKFQFWKASTMFGNMFDEEKIKQQQQLAKEKRDLLIALLGTAPDEKADVAALMNPFQDMLDFLPDGKQSQVIDILQSYQAKALKAMKDGAPDAQDMKQMQKVQKEMEAELAKILSPQEFEEYQLRLSQTAMMMRMQLASFDPSEQEFRDIFKLRKQFDDEYGYMPDFSDTKRKDAEKAMKDEIKQLLGDDRYADYDRAQDYSYQAIAKAVSRAGLPKETGVKLFDMKKTAEDEARKVRNDSSLTADQRNAALAGIHDETERSMISTMGQQAYDNYKKQPGAYWLKNLAPSKTAKK